MNGWAADWGVVLLTLDVAARSVVLAFPVAIALALPLARGKFPGRSILDVIVHLPLVLPPVVVGWLLLLIFGVRGPIGGWLHAALGLRLVFTTWGAALACAVMALPLMVRALRLSLEAIDPGLLHAARTLGATPLDCVASIALPLAAPGLVTALLVGFAAALGEFGAVITFAANIPGRTQTLALAIYAALQVPGGEAVAGRLALEAIALAVTFLLAADLAARAINRRLGK